MISILMATYNGERYVEEQIRSIFSQTFQDFVLHVQDDCSTDRTWEIVNHLQREFLDRMVLSQNASNSGGAGLNFLKMITAVRDDYVMLCDQDDVWLSEKIEKTFAKMQEMEREFGVETPILVHSDLSVTNEHLEIIAPSFRRAMHANYNRTAFRQVLIQNTLTGCTAMYNRSLADRLTDMPECFVMHDWWLLLVAAAFGRVGHINDCTVLYRQHGNNQIGAKDVRTFRYKWNRFVHSEEIRLAIAQTYLQARSFLCIYGDRLPQHTLDELTVYCNIPEKGKLARIGIVFSGGYRKNGFFRNVAHLMFL